jgi:hypothetical protein
MNAAATFAREFAAGADPRLFSDDAVERATPDLGAGAPGLLAGVDLYDGSFRLGSAPGGVGMRSWHRLPDGRFYSVDPMTEAVARQYAVNSFPGYPGGGPQVTVDTALQMPNILARALTDLAYQRFVADRILARGTPDQVRGGAAVFQRAESLFPDRQAELVGVRSEWPRTGWTVPDLFAAAVKKYGLESIVSDEARRRNAMDQLARALRKIANSTVRFVDSVAMTLITTDPAVQTASATATWTGVSAKIIADLAAARNLIQNIDLGYVANTLIINPAQELALLTDTTIQGVLPRESTPRNAVVTGRPVPILGLDQILVTNQLAAGKYIVCDAGTVGTIADEQPMAEEGYYSYDVAAGGGPGSVPAGLGAPSIGPLNQPTMYAKTYREDSTDGTVVRGARFPAMWISEPQAAVYGSGA